MDRKREGILTRVKKSFFNGSKLVKVVFPLGLPSWEDPRVFAIFFLRSRLFFGGGVSARLAQGVVERDAIRDVRLVLGVQDRGGEEAEVGNGAGNIERTRERERLAGVDRFSARELLQIALDQIGDAQKDARSLRRRFF